MMRPRRYRPCASFPRGPCRWRDLDKHQLALDMRGFRKIDDFDDVDQLVQLLVICSMISSLPEVTMVSRDNETSSVGATVSVSIL